MVLEARWIFDRQPYRVEVDGGICRRVEAAAGNPQLWLAPGMVDLQVNGYKGVDYSSPDLTVQQVEQVCRHLTRRGTTRHLATIITSPQQLIVGNLRTIAQARAASPLVAASLVGVHVEGPYISPVDGPRGVHNRQHVRPASVAEFEQWQQSAPGLVKLVTIAPEQQQACPFIRHVTAQGVIASLGHTDASPQECEAALAAGARMTTHFGNGTKRILPRFDNALWWQLGADQVTTSLIADGFHVHPAVVKVAARAKSGDGLLLVSDVCPLAGLPAGSYRWGNNHIRLHKDGHIAREEDGRLAGAGFLLDWCVPHFRHFADCDLASAYYAASLLPARLLNLPTTAPPKEGDHADFICFQDSPQQLQLTHGFLAGMPLREKSHTPLQKETSW